MRFVGILSDVFLKYANDLNGGYSTGRDPRLITRCSRLKLWSPDAQVAPDVAEACAICKSARIVSYCFSRLGILPTAPLLLSRFSPWIEGFLKVRSSTQTACQQGCARVV